jgi:hypothetical protein
LSDGSLRAMLDQQAEACSTFNASRVVARLAAGRGLDVVAVAVDREKLGRKPRP